MDFIEVERLPKCSTKFKIKTNFNLINKFLFVRELEDPKILIISKNPPEFYKEPNILYIGTGEEGIVHIPKKYKDEVLKAIDLINKEMI